MKKKLVSMILCVAMVATMAVGCGSGAKNNDRSFRCACRGNEIYGSRWRLQ